MKNVLKKGLAVFMSIIMAISIPIIAYADSILDITLTVNSNKDCYAGVTYDVVATINNVTSQQLIGDSDTTTAFTWKADNNATISTTNDYKITQVTTNNYTVSETAKVSFTDKVGTTVIKASYGNAGSQSLSVETLQPITSITIQGQENDNANYYYKSSDDSSDDILYLNYSGSSSKDVAKLIATQYPEQNDDKYLVTGTDSSYTTITSSGNSLSVAFTNKNCSDSTVTLSPESGYKFTKKFSVLKCIPLTSFDVYSDSTKIASSGEDNSGAISTIAGDSLVFTISNKKPTDANDKFEYKLYTDSSLSALAPSSYCMYEQSGKCTLNISNPGTYYLVCSAVSRGGYLPRDLKAYVQVTVTEANPITSINLYNLNSDGTFNTNSPLEAVTLYTSTSKTYDLKNNLSILPIGYSYGVKYLSADTSIATVSSSGVITAKAKGSTTVYVYSEKNEDVVTSCQVNVIQELTSIDTITAETMTIPQGHSVQLYAVTTPTTTDEKIRWASQNPDALTVTADGYATANADYDLTGKEKQLVLVTATSDSGKQQQQYITIVPSISATNIQINAAGTSSATFSQNEDLSYTAYNGDSFTLTSVGTDDKGNVSNDIYKWTVKAKDGSEMSFDQAVTNGYFTYKYDSAIDTYTITTKSSGEFEFKSYALKRGEIISDNTVSSSISISIKEKATSLTIYNLKTNATYSSDTLTTYASVNIGVKLAPQSAYVDDPVTFTSSNESIATVTPIADSPNTAKVQILDQQGTVTITAKTASGSKSATLKITVSSNINAAEVTGIDESYPFNNGKAITPVPTVTYNGMTLTKGIDYNLTYSNNTSAGTATITITGINNFKNSTKEVTFKITPKKLDKKYISITVNSEYYSIKKDDPNPLPTLTVKDTERNVTLNLDKSYTLTAVNNTKPGTATATLTGKGNYTGTLTVKYKVCYGISLTTVSSVSNQQYTGSYIKPTVKVTCKGKTLQKDTDYTVTYKNNYSIGEASIVITGITPNLKGTKTITFKIVPKKVSGLKTSKRTSNTITLSWNSNSTASGYEVYDVVNKKTIAKITSYSKNSMTIKSLKTMKAYSYKVRAYKLVNGTTYYGPYSSVNYTYTTPSVPSVTLKTGSKYVTASWKKISSVSGYQVQYSTKSSFSGAKSTNVSSSATSKKITGLKKGTKYYVRVRSYKKMKVNGKTVTVYSSWSTKSIKCK